MIGGTDLWADAIRGLERWHTNGDRGSLEAALQFLSAELPLLLSSSLTHRIGTEAVRDLVQEFLLALQMRPLPAIPAHPRSYLGRAVQNRALSQLRRTRDEPVATLPESPPEVLDAVLERQVAAREVLQHLQELSMEDRVALKLSMAPEALDAEELRWLASRCGLSTDEVRQRALQAERAEDRVVLYEHALGMADEAGLARAIDRLHKRVSRARQRLLERIRGES